MNYLEMFVVVLAIMLFATVAIVHNRAMQTAADLVTNASHTVQSMQLAQEVLDEIDARLFIPKEAQGLKYINIIDQYGGTQRERDLQHYGGSFHVDIQAEPCDPYGSTTVANNLKTRILVTVQVYGPPGQSHEVTQSRIYTPFSVEGF